MWFGIYGLGMMALDKCSLLSTAGSLLPQGKAKGQGTQIRASDTELRAFGVSGMGTSGLRLGPCFTSARPRIRAGV